MFKAFKNLFGTKEAPPDSPAAAPEPYAPKPKPAPPAEKLSYAPEPEEEHEEEPPPFTEAAAPAQPTLSAEELCSISPEMSREEIRQRLALLYRRYNRAASSLNAGLRAEANTMLDAIVEVRVKTFGPV